MSSRASFRRLTLPARHRPLSALLLLATLSLPLAAKDPVQVSGSSRLEREQKQSSASSRDHLINLEPKVPLSRATRGPDLPSFVLPDPVPVTRVPDKKALEALDEKRNWIFANPSAKPALNLSQKEGSTDPFLSVGPDKNKTSPIEKYLQRRDARTLNSAASSLNPAMPGLFEPENGNSLDAGDKKEKERSDSFQSTYGSKASFGRNRGSSTSDPFSATPDKDRNGQSNFSLDRSVANRPGLNVFQRSAQEQDRTQSGNSLMGSSPLIRSSGGLVPSENSLVKPGGLNASREADRASSGLLARELPSASGQHGNLEYLRTGAGSMPELRSSSASLPTLPSFAPRARSGSSALDMGQSGGSRRSDSPAVLSYPKRSF